MSSLSRRHRGIRVWAAVALFTMLVAACSGSKTTSELSSGRSPAPGETPDLSDDAASTEEDEESVGSTGGSGSGGTSGGDSEATVSAPGEDPQVQKDEKGVPVANLFKADEARVGITPDEIRLCMHAAFIFGDVFNNKREDEDVYWRMVNANGGIYNRKVSIQMEDDAYNANQAVTAANSCKENKAFMILSGVGFDQIPAVREWAEQNRQLYLHSMATEDGTKGKQFSFAVAPTLQMVGRQIAQYFIKAYPGKKYAAISRNSPNWDGALDEFERELANHGKTLAFRQKVDNGQDYNVVINDMKGKCAANECAVFANENVLNFAKMYQQANNPPHNYRPQWFNYGFQLTNDTIGESTANNPPLEAWYPTPAFDPTNTTKQPWWGEIQAMKDAYAKYCKSPCDKDPDELNDVDWQFWLVFKSMHRLLLDCGPDCSRNHIVGLFLDGYKTKVDPLCEADFSHGAHHFGAHKANIYRAVEYPNGSVFKQIETCRDSYL